MIRNFVAGALWGGVVAGVGLGVISQVTPMPGEMAQPDVAPSEPVAVQVADAEAQANAMMDQPEAKTAAKTVEPGDAPAPAAPDPNLPETPQAVVPDARQPDAPAVAEADPAPKTTTETATGADSPATAPVSAEPGSGEKPAVQPLTQADAPAALAKTDAEGTAPALVANGDAATTAVAPGGLPAAAAAEMAPPAAELPPPAAPQADEALLNPAPVPAQDPAPAQITMEPEAAPAETAPQPGLLTDTAPDTLPATGTLSPDVDGVTTGRLPRIGDAAAPPAETAPTRAEDTPPIRRFARPFQNDSGKPLFAVLLRDTGGADVDRARLAALPFPVTFVVDPLADNAAEAATIYRAAGQEVVMLASGIPDGAQASDLEQTFQSHSGTLPDAVAVMDPGPGGFQDNRPLATQVVPLVKAQGRGLITFERGLNAADQVARREDVASATIYRQLDAEGQDTPLIRRMLDRASFKAAQEGRVMVLGDTRPQTIAALMEWTLEGRASSVTLAPATAVMTVK